MYWQYNKIHSLIWIYFPDIADGLVGVGLITSSEDCPGVLTLDKGYNEMSKFLNRILGMHVEKQNLLFKYFSDTLAAIIQQAKSLKSALHEIKKNKNVFVGIYKSET